VNTLCVLCDELVQEAMQLDEHVTLSLHDIHVHGHVLGQVSHQEGAHETLRLHPDIA
jgi:hypothetical protein